MAWYTTLFAQSIHNNRCFPLSFTDVLVGGTIGKISKWYTLPSSVCVRAYMRVCVWGMRACECICACVCDTIDIILFLFHVQVYWCACCAIITTTPMCLMWTVIDHMPPFLPAAMEAVNLNYHTIPVDSVSDMNNVHNITNFFLHEIIVSCTIFYYTVTCIYMY